ncbi:ubinuclein-2 isoform X1 [Bufo gargarizans]|uniref:ubinuclein-2 isoform X1 n=1 Tax=Bufo gargarizans TaxID=30331 RepID=UPI001CF36499|nr:ubinuclein-2 isoform X1 [Bufo gargarizans]
MAEPRRVPFVSLSPVKPRETGGSLLAEQQRSTSTPSAAQRSQVARPPLPGMQPRPSPQTSLQRPQREAATSSTTVREAGACPAKANSKAEDEKQRAENTIRLELTLTDPTEESCAEFSYRVLLQNEKKGGSVAKEEEKAPPSNDPFNDDERERLEVERIAKKFEAKYGVKSHRHRKDRMQDLIDIGYGYDETDPFIDNSEAYDELVPASLTTKYGGFYINTGTLQFRQASDSEAEDFVESKKHKSSKVSKLKDDDRSLKKRKRKEDPGEKEKQSRKLKVAKSMGVVAFNAHKPDKKKKKLYKDSMALAAMLQKFQKEKDAMRKNENKPNPPTVTVVSAPPKANTTPISSDLSDLTLGNDPVLAIFGGGSERELLQEAECALKMLGDFDLDKLLDSASNDSPAASDQGENGNVVQSTNPAQVQTPKPIPPLPEGLPAQLEKRIEDLRAAAKMFDEEGRKKFFTQEMNNILLDIELQLQELGPATRNGVYGYIEAFVPCTKDTLVKRLKKLHLHIQDDRLKEPLQKLKTAISNVMPGQLNRYQEDCQAHNQARNAKHQADDDRERNPSEEEDEEKPGKRVMGPRKKFCWDDTIRNLLCNLVKIKLGCYELEPSKSQTAEDYLKNFMETEVKPLWPKGWMQSRMLFKESRSVHNHLTSAPAKKKVILVPKLKTKELSPKKEQKLSTLLPTVARTPSINSTPIGGPASSTCSETICLDDSLDEQLSFKTPSLESISEALAVLNNGSVPQSSSHADAPTSRPKVTLREEKLASIMSKLPLGGPKKADTAQHTTSLIAGHSTPVPKKPQDHATAHSTVVSGLIAGSSIQNPKVSLEPLPAKLLQQGLQRSLQAEVSSSSTPAKMKASSASQPKTACAPSSTSPSPTSVPLTSSSHAHVSSSSSQVQNSSLQTVKVNPPIQQNYVTPLQVTISKSHTNPVVRLTSSPQISSTSPIIKTPEKTVGYRPPSSPSPGSSQHAPVSRTAASSTSSNLMSKNVCAHSNPGFKSPYTMAPSPSSSSSCSPVPQSTPHHKLASGMNIGRPSPTVSPIPSGRGTAILQGVRNPSAPPKIPSSSPKLVSPVNRQPSSSPKIPVSSPIPSPVPSPKLSSPPPKIQSQSPKPPNPPMKTPNPSTKSVNSTHPGPVKATISSSVINVPISRANQNSNVSNRTHISGASGSGALGATKQPMPHRQPSASGSPIAAATVQSATASLLANTAPLTLMTSPLSVTNPNVTTSPLGPFGMLGGLVPVTMPFQFPLELLNFGSDTAGAVTSPGSTSAAFHHNITQNLLKGLQATPTHTPTISHSALPPHMQQGYTDAAQSKGDSKLQRKNP